MKDFVNFHIKNKELYIGKELADLIIEETKNEILKNKENYYKLQEIDNNHYEQITKIETIIEILDNGKNSNVSPKVKKEMVIASYLGNPYITVNLFVQAIYNKKAIMLCIEDYMLSTNKLLVKIFNMILEKHKIYKLVELYNLCSINEIVSVQDDMSNIICIGNGNTFYRHRKENIKNLKYLPFKNIAIFSDDMKYNDLQSKLHNYALSNGIDVEIYYDIELEEFIECMNIDETIENVVVFTQDLEKAEQIRNSIKNKRIFINENPFKNEKFYIENL